MKRAYVIINESFEVVDMIITKASRCVDDTDTIATQDIKDTLVAYYSLFSQIDLTRFKGESFQNRRQ